MEQPSPPMVSAVLEVARRQLGEVGPAALSLRAIAREVGVVPSALYRYLPGREAILTELVRSGYQRLGDAVRAEHDAVAGDDHLGRWCTTWQATRDWAVAHRHEYALLYGTPVLGYRAPTSTVAPATIVVLTLAAIAVDAARTAHPEPPPGPGLPASLRADADALVTALPGLGLDATGATPELVMEVVAAWTTLFGAVSFELFGHYVGSVSDHRGHLDHLARAAAARLGVQSAPKRSRV